MTAPLPANEATFSLRSHPLFPTIYQCALIPPAFVISQPGWQICSLHWCTCLSANSQKLLFFRLAVWLLHQMLVLVVGGKEGCVWVEVGRGAKKKEKSWLAKQREISFAQQIRTAARYKLSGWERVFACVCALMSVVMCLRWWEGAAAYVLHINVCVCVLMKGSIYCSCIGIFFFFITPPPLLLLLLFVSGPVTMSGG